MTPTFNKQIFLTYDPRDAELARQVHAEITESGRKCWCEAVDLVPGQCWDEVIPAQLRASSIVVVLITGRWPKQGESNSDWYGPEKVAIATEAAQQRGTKIIVMFADGGTEDRIPYGLTLIKGRENVVYLGRDSWQSK